MAKSIEQRVGDLEQVLEDLPGILNIRFAQAKSERDEIKSSLATLDAKITALDARFGGVDTRFASMDAKNAGLNARMSGLELRLEEMKPEIRALPRVIGQIISEHLKPA